MRSPPPHVREEQVRQLYDRLAAGHDQLHGQGILGWLAHRDNQAILDLLMPKPGLSLLEVGCGTGRHARLFTSLGLRVCAIDLSPAMVEQARPHVEEAQVADLANLSLGRLFERVTATGAGARGGPGANAVGGTGTGTGAVGASAGFECSGTSAVDAWRSLRL